MDAAGWISIVINVALVAAAFVGKKWIEASVEKSVEHKFEQQLAAFNSDLRKKESEIASLRDGILSGRAQRQALLDKRRLEAVERIWKTIGKLAPFELTSASMAHIEFNVAAARAPHDAKLQKFFQVISNQSLFDEQFSGQPKAAFAEQPFLSPLAWAYFSAYQSVVMMAFMKAKLLADGMEEADKFIKIDALRDLMKAALPHQAAYIDKNDSSAYHFLLEELKDRLLNELRKMLEGKDIDKAAIDQAKEINEALKRVDADQAAARVAKIEAISTNGAKSETAK